MRPKGNEIAIVLTFILLLFSSCYRNSEDELNEELKSLFAHSYPEPVLASVHGEKCLLKTRSPEGFVLHIGSLEDGSIQSFPASKFTQFSLRWSTSERFLFYQRFNDKKMAYDPFIYEIDLQSEQKVEGPTSFSALPPVEVHPSDSFLAYVSTDNGIQLNLISLVESRSSVYPIAEVSLFSDFVWRDSGTLLYINSRLNEIRIFDPSNRSDVQLYLHPEQKIKSLQTGRNGTVYFTAWQENHPYDKGVILKNGVTSEIKISENIEAIFPYRDTLIVVDTNLGGIKKTLLLNDKQNVVNDFHNSAVNRIVGDSLFLLQFDLYEPVSLSLFEKGETKTYFQKTPTLQSFQFQSVLVNDSLPTYVWLPQHTRNICFIDVHGGPNLHVDPYWDAVREFLCEEGATIIAANYRGSSGYSHDYETEGGLLYQIEDLNMQVNYAVKTLEIPKSEIFFIGRSYGSKIIQHYLLQHPKESFGGWLILGGSLSKDKPLPVNLSHPALAFYGEFDHLGILDFQYLRASQGNKLLLHVLKNEGHHFHHTSSTAEIYTAVSKWYLQ